MHITSFKESQQQFRSETDLYKSQKQYWSFAISNVPLSTASAVSAQKSNPIDNCNKSEQIKLNIYKINEKKVLPSGHLQHLRRSRILN